MSRKNHRTAATVPVARTPRSAVHRRRRRGIRHYRPAAPSASTARKPRRSVAPPRHPRLFFDRISLEMSTCIFLLGAAVSLGAAGIYLSLQSSLDSPFAPYVRAVHLLPLALILPAALGSLGPSLLTSRLGLRMPGACPATIGFVGLATGLCTATLPFVLSCAGLCVTWIHAHFVLSDWPLRLLQLAIMLLVCTLPLAGLGLAGQLMHAMDHPSRERKRPAVRPAFALGVLTGIAAGIFIAAWLAARPATLLPAASLPMLLLAVIAGRLPDSSPAVAISKPT